MKIKITVMQWPKCLLLQKRKLFIFNIIFIVYEINSSGELSKHFITYFCLHFQEIFLFIHLKTHMQWTSKGVNYTELHYIFKHLFAGTQTLLDISSVSCQRSTEFDRKAPLLFSYKLCGIVLWEIYFRVGQNMKQCA